MTGWFRNGFYGGLSLTLLVGWFLAWLWQPARQVSRHTDNLFYAAENKNWSAVADFIGSDYRDQWGYDRARVLERAREVFHYMRGVRIMSSSATVFVDNRQAYWRGKITIDGEEGEVMTMVKERVNPLATSFELEWRRLSAKPWDWKLVRVSNPSLEIPADFY